MSIAGLIPRFKPTLRIFKFVCKFLKIDTKSYLIGLNDLDAQSGETVEPQG